jgi:hypothetical protein
MNTKLKYSLAFTAVLIMGFILGFLVSGRLIHSRVARMQRYFTPMGFRYEFRRVLHPSPEQLREMKPVLDEYAQKNRENLMLFREQQKALLQHLQHDLKPFLTPQQLERLNAIEHRRFRWMRNRPQHRPPPLHP